MATRPKAIKKTTNRPQQFNEILTPALPMAPALSEATLGNRRVMLPAAMLLGSVLTGILAGLAIRGSFFATNTSVAAGPIAVDQAPGYARIMEAQSLASAAVQTIQVTPDTTNFQLTGDLQTGSSINIVQPGLSAYDAQGSVGAPASH